MKKVHLLLACLTICSNVFAQKFFEIDLENIIYTPSANWSNVERDLVKDLLGDLEVEGQEQIDSIDSGTYLQDSINTQGLTHSLTGMDHGSDFKYFLVGGSFSAGLNLNGKGIGDVLSGNVEGDDLKGFSAGGGAVFGFNLNPKTQIFLSGFKYEFQKDEFTLNFLNVGAKVRYQFIDGFGNALFRWNGLRLNTGIQFSELKIGYDKSIDIKQSKSSAGIDIEARLKTDIQAQVSLNTLSIPLEASTSITVLSILTPYVGLGANLNFGSANGDVKLTDTEVNVTKSGGSGSGTATTEASANFGEKQKPGLVDPKMFLGLQLDLWKLKVGAQYDKSLTTQSQGVGFTVKLAI